MTEFASTPPSLSVVLVCAEGYPTIARTVRSLATQSVCGQIELVVVGQSHEALKLFVEDLAGFHSYQVIELGRSLTVAAGNAAGVRMAAAPIVVLGEDHCFPDQGWAQALIEAHAGPWAAVGPVMCNANPGNAVSWADLLIGYGPWAEPSGGGEMSFLPGHNSSYKRDVLLQYGEELEARLAAEAVMHWDLRAKGHRLYLEPSARVHHLNLRGWGVGHSCNILMAGFSRRGGRRGGRLGGG